MSTTASLCKRMDIQLRRAATSIHNADALLFTSGAGMGCDSGLPDFRGVDGFWRAYPAFAKLGYAFEEISRPIWFDQDPRVAWGFFGHRLNLYLNTIPHRGYDLLRSWGVMKNHNYFVFTSNVDGAYTRAGYAPELLCECHGTLMYQQCTTPCSKFTWSVDHGFNIKVDDATCKATSTLPRCHNCNALARPQVLMFDDMKWVSDRTDAQRVRFEEFVDDIRKNQLKLAIIEIGAGLAVPTVRRTSEYTAVICKADLIRINPHESDIDNVTYEKGISISMTGLAALKKINTFLKTEHGWDNRN